MYSFGYGVCIMVELVVNNCHYKDFPIICLDIIEIHNLCFFHCVLANYGLLRMHFWIFL